ADRPDRARRLHPAPGRAGRVREHPRALGRRPLPRAPPRVLVRQRRRGGAVLLQRRLAGAQPAAPDRGLLPDPRPRPARARARRGARQLPGRQPQRLGIAAGRQLPQTLARRGRAAALGAILPPFEALRMTGSPATPDAPVTSFRDGDMLAAIDIGSNSFHMVVARYTLGQLRIVDRLRETVRMAEGLDAAGNLHPDAMRRALGCLARFGQRLRGIPPANVRALATNTVRAMATPKAFLVPAESALGHPIEVISGREEARLIYLGVAHAEPPRPGQRRLVIDIGGGSTECIIGTGFEPIERESLQAGCIAITRRHFPDGRLSAKRWHEAVIAVSAEFQQFASAFVALGWHEVLGASGTNKAISGICASMKLTKG